ncbi:carbon-nitrogen hydrolase family protein, partial [Vibrio parahaemolyticus V-223/04]
MANACDER